MSQNTHKIDISENKRFAVYGSDLRFYDTNPDTTTSLRIISTDFPNIKYFQWHPQPFFNEFFGLTYGRSRMLIGKVVEDSGHLGVDVVSEFNRANRVVNFVSWAPLDGHLLLAGFDRMRGDAGLCLFDVGRTLEEGFEFNSVVGQYGTSWGVNTACWLHSSHTFVAGMAFKWIKGYDHRDQINTVFSIDTRSVLGLEADPFDETKFASFGEDANIKIWDTRNTSYPMLTINPKFPNGISSINWCNEIRGIISASGRDNPMIKLWNLDLHPTEDESRPNKSYLGITVSRNISAGENVNHFQWTTGLEVPMMLVSTGRESRIRMMSIPSKKICRWSPSGSLSLTNNSSVSIYEYVSDGDEDLMDISAIMYNRAVAGYSLDLNTNLELLADKEDLSEVWKYVSIISQAKKNILQFRNLNLNSIVAVVDNCKNSHAELKDKSLGFPLTIYSSEVRDIGLVLCGWNFSENKQGSAFFQDEISRLKYEGNVEKAAAMIFLFYGDLKRAIEFLNSSQDERLLLAAAALTGCFGNKSNSNLATLKSIFLNISYQMQDPYLRTIFGMVAVEGNWLKTLKRSHLPLSDRMAIALRFLDDSEVMFSNKIKVYTTSLIERMVSNGRIDGLFLTGWTMEGLDLLESYVNLHGDVQTAALLISTYQIPIDPRVEIWVETYRDLLDQWRLFQKRAILDIGRRRLVNNAKSIKQISIRCGYCNQSISTGLSHDTNVPPSITNFSAVKKQKPLCCPHCLKPLPRCTLCLLPMGTPFETLSNEEDEFSVASKFDEWFSWCITCQHGGHAKHLYEWFKENSQCPVSSCTCRCSQEF